MDKNKLLQTALVRTDEISVGGQKLTIREIGTEEFTAYGEQSKTDKTKATAGLIAACVVDEAGAPLLTQEEALGLAKIVRTALPIVNAVMKISGIGVEESEKHSDAG